MLRHTFCSHLAMRGAPARAIQELAGHQDLQTTQQCRHLSPSAVDAAIRLPRDRARKPWRNNGGGGKIGPFYRLPFDARSASLRLADRLLRTFSLRCAIGWPTAYSGHSPCKMARHERTFRFAEGEPKGESNGGGGGSRTRTKRDRELIDGARLLGLTRSFDGTCCRSPTSLASP